LAFSDPFHGVAVGTAGRIVSTEDGGKNWKEIASPTEDTLLNVQFHGELQVTAIGLRGAVTSSDDGGKSWRVLALPRHYAWLSGIAFTKDGSGYLVGDGGRIFVSKDGGGTWARFGS